MRQAGGHDPQLLKGLVGLLILGVLNDGESYGYEIASKLRTSGLAELKEGTVYPALSRLEKDGLLATRLVESPSGPARKYYRLTNDGRVNLRERKKAWHLLVQVVDDVCS